MRKTVLIRRIATRELFGSQFGIRSRCGPFWPEGFCNEMRSGDHTPQVVICRYRSSPLKRCLSLVGRALVTEEVQTSAFPIAIHNDQIAGLYLAARHQIRERLHQKSLDAAL